MNSSKILKSYGVFDYMTDNFGAEISDYLLKSFPGKKVYFPKNPNNNTICTILINMLGTEKTQMFFNCYGGFILCVPSLKAQKRINRNKAIYAAYDDMSRKGMTSRQIIIYLADNFDLSIKHVQKLLRKRLSEFGMSPCIR